MGRNKRFVALFLAALMVMQMMPLNALADTLKGVASNVLSTADKPYYDVTFYVDGEPVARQLVESGAALLVVPEEPAKQGYSFDGWEADGVKIEAGSVVNGTIDAVAKFTPIDQYKVTIQYVDENGKPVASEVVRNYYAGETEPETVDSPAMVSVEGEMLYPDQTSVTIDPSTLTDAETPIIVIYKKSDATYTVVHMVETGVQEDGTRDYKENSRETLNGVMGSVVTPNPLDASQNEEFYKGYVFERVESKKIEAETGTEICVYYVRKDYALRYDPVGGSYVEPKYGKYEETVAVYTGDEGTTELNCGMQEDTHVHTDRPKEKAKDHHNETIGCYTSSKGNNDKWGWVFTCKHIPHTHISSCYTTTPATWNPAPTREGYEFTGWYLDEACETPADATITLTGETTVYAGWKAREVGYTVVYMKQVYNNATNKKEYVYHTSARKTGTVGTTVTGDAGKVPSYYHLGTAGTATVKADGSTVVMVYYDLTEYTFIFNLDDENAKIEMDRDGDGRKETYTGSNYKFTAVLGQDVSAIWPTPDNTTTTSKDDGKKQYLDKWGGNYKTKRFEVTPDMLDGDSGSKSGTTITYKARWTTSNTLWIVNYYLQKADGSGYDRSEIYSQKFIKSGDLSAKKIYGFHYEESRNDTENQIYNFYYDRDTFNITFMYKDTQLKKTDAIRFGADISGQKYTPSTPTDLVEDYTFGGWYDNADLAGEVYNFTTMPASNVVLYAKWNAPDRTVELVYSNGDKNHTETLPYGETLAEVDDPVRDGYIFQGWSQDEYVEDWKGQSGAFARFDETMPITKNITLYAHWKMNDLSYTVYYREQGTDKELHAPKKVSNPNFNKNDVIPENYVSVDGYRVDAATKSTQPLQPGVDGSITFYYTKREVVNYTVRYRLESNHDKELLPDATIQSGANDERVVAVAPYITPWMARSTRRPMASLP